MSKEKDVFRELMRVFVSASIYILMFLVAVFIFYQTITLFLFVFGSIYHHIQLFFDMNMDSISEASTLWIQLAGKVLNVVTFILVLVKSFKILVSYSKHHHIEIKDLVEISIIALLMEVVFNFGLHSLALNWLFSGLSVVLIILYAGFPYFHKTHRRK